MRKNGAGDATPHDWSAGVKLDALKYSPILKMNAQQVCVGNNAPFVRAGVAQ